MPSNYEKSYARINWKNFPDRATPLNEANLNLMDGSLNVIDNRVIELDTTKLDLSVGQTMVNSVTFDKTTGTFTITYLNGNVVNYNTDLEKVATNFEYDHETEELILMDSDGHELTRIDLSALITQYEFDSSSTVTFNVSAGGRVSAEVPDGSITANKLQPNYLADIQRNKNEAVAASTLSQSYAVGGTNTRPGEDTDNAKYYKEQSEIVMTTVLKPQGNTLFADLPASPSQGDMYKVTDDFTTDNRFEEPNKEVKAPIFIYFNGTKWVLFASSGGDTHIIGTRNQCISWARQGMIPDGSVCIFTDDYATSTPYVVGTQTQINAMLSQGLLGDGTVCVITDDYTEELNLAENIGYDNTTSGLSADDVQGAIDELNSDLNDISSKIIVKNYPIVASINGVAASDGNVALLNTYAGIIMLDCYGATKLHFNSSDVVGLQIGGCVPSATLPTIISTGEGRGSYINYTTTIGDNVITLPSRGITGNIFIGLTSSNPTTISDIYFTT